MAPSAADVYDAACMRVTVQFYAQARERAGRESEQVDISSGANIAALWKGLLERYPGLASLDGGISFVVGRACADRATVLSEGDEVSLLPPVSGG